MANHTMSRIDMLERRFSFPRKYLWVAMRDQASTALGAVSRVPIVVLSIRSSEQEKIAALDAGASHYVTKPFAIGELTARLRAFFRDRPSETRIRSVYEAGPLRVDVAGHRVFLADCEVKLPPKEFALLVTRVSNRGRVVTHRQLLIGV